MEGAGVATVLQAESRNNMIRGHERKILLFCIFYLPFNGEEHLSRSSYNFGKKNSPADGGVFELSEWIGVLRRDLHRLNQQIQLIERGRERVSRGGVQHVRDRGVVRGEI